MSDIESIVNKNHDVRSFARERVATRKRIRRLRKMLIFVIAMAFVAGTTVALGIAGAVHFVLAMIVSILAVMAGCFTLGMYVEAVKRK